MKQKRFLKLLSSAGIAGAIAGKTLQHRYLKVIAKGEGRDVIGRQTKAQPECEPIIKECYGIEICFGK